MQIFIGCFFCVIRKDDEPIDGNVELFQGIQLFFVVGVADDDVSPDFIELAQMVDLWDDVLEGEVFGRWGLRPFIFSVFVFLFGLFGSSLAFLRLW